MVTLALLFSPPRIEPMKKIARSLRQHRELILNRP